MFAYPSRKQSRRLIARILIIILTPLAGCHTVASRESPILVQRDMPPSAVESLLNYAELLPYLSEAALSEEMASAEPGPLDLAGAAEAIRFAVLNVEGRTRSADLNQVRASLENAVRSGDTDPHLVTLARLLLDFYVAGAQSEQPETTVVLAYPLSRRIEPAESPPEFDVMRRALAEERELRLALEKQLAALRALEEILNNRASVSLDTVD